jgi:hypothetical protein
LVHPQHAIVAKVGLLDPAVLEGDLSPQGATDAVDHTTLDLRGHDVGVDDRPAVHHAHDSPHPDLAATAHFHLGDLRHVGVPPAVHQRQPVSVTCGERLAPSGFLGREVEHRAGPGETWISTFSKLRHLSE